MVLCRIVSLDTKSDGGDYLPVFMKDKRVKLAGARWTLRVSSKVGELSDAQRHRAKKAFNGFSWPSGEPSKGSVRKQPRFSQFPNAPRKKCNRPAAERGSSGSPTQNDELAYSSRLDMRWLFSCATGCCSFTSSCCRGRRYVEETSSKARADGRWRALQGPSSARCSSSRPRIFPVSPM